MENVITSQGRLLWDKLGKWQLLFTVMMLCVFFITLHFTGDRKIAIFNTFVVIVLSMAYGLFASVATEVPMAIAWTAGIAATIIAGVLIATDIAIALACIAVSIALLFAIPSIAEVAGEMKDQYTVRKVMTFFSFSALFLVLLIPIVLH